MSLSKSLYSLLSSGSEQEDLKIVDWDVKSITPNKQTK